MTASAARAIPPEPEEETAAPVGASASTEPPAGAPPPASSEAVYESGRAAGRDEALAQTAPQPRRSKTPVTAWAALVLAMAAILLVGIQYFTTGEVGFERQMAEAENRLTAVEGGLNGLNSRVGEVEKKQALTQAFASDQQKLIAAVQGSVTANTGILDQHGGRLTTLEEGYAALQAQVTDLFGKVVAAPAAPPPVATAPASVTVGTPTPGFVDVVNGPNCGRFIQQFKEANAWKNRARREKELTWLAATYPALTAGCRSVYPDYYAQKKLF